MKYINKFQLNESIESILSKISSSGASSLSEKEKEIFYRHSKNIDIEDKHQDGIKFEFDSIEFLEDEFRLWGVLSIKGSSFYGYLFGFPFMEDPNDYGYEAFYFYKSKKTLKKGEYNLEKTDDLDFLTYAENKLYSKVKDGNKKIDMLCDWMRDTYLYYCSKYLKKPLDKEYFLEMFSELLDNGWWGIQCEKNKVVKIDKKDKEKVDYLITLEKQSEYVISRDIFKIISDDIGLVHKTLNLIRSHGDVLLTNVQFINVSPSPFPNKILLTFKENRLE